MSNQSNPKVLFSYLVKHWRYSQSNMKFYNSKQTIAQHVPFPKYMFPIYSNPISDIKTDVNKRILTLCHYETKSFRTLKSSVCNKYTAVI